MSARLQGAAPHGGAGGRGGRGRGRGPEEGGKEEEEEEADEDAEVVHSFGGVSESKRLHEYEG